MQVHDKTVIVTGAGSGLGRSLARALHLAGARVALAGRRLERLQETAAECGQSDRVIIVQTDVARHRDLRNLRQKTLDRFGTIDIVINNAGIGYGGGVGDIQPEEVRHNTNVNLVAPIWLIHLVVPDLMKRPESLIVNIISLSGLVGMPCQSVYVASKFGLAGYSEALRRDLSGTNTRVLEVYPGAMDTELNTQKMRDAGALHGLKINVLHPDAVAAMVMKSISRDDTRLIAAAPVDRLLPRINALVPGLINRALEKVGPGLRVFMLMGNEWIRSRNPLDPVD